MLFYLLVSATSVLVNMILISGVTLLFGVLSWWYHSILCCFIILQKKVILLSCSLSCCDLWATDSQQLIFTSAALCVLFNYIQIKREIVIALQERIVIIERN